MGYREMPTTAPDMVKNDGGVTDKNRRLWRAHIMLNPAEERWGVPLDRDSPDVDSM